MPQHAPATRPSLMCPCSLPITDITNASATPSCVRCKAAAPTTWLCRRCTTADPTTPRHAHHCCCYTPSSPPPPAGVAPPTSPQKCLPTRMPQHTHCCCPIPPPRRSCTPQKRRSTPTAATTLPFHRQCPRNSAMCALRSCSPDNTRAHPPPPFLPAAANPQAP